VETLKVYKSFFLTFPRHPSSTSWNLCLSLYPKNFVESFPSCLKTFFSTRTSHLHPTIHGKSHLCLLSFCNIRSHPFLLRCNLHIFQQNFMQFNHHLHLPNHMLSNLFSNLFINVSFKGRLT
jgi:hypothetical protein